MALMHFSDWCPCLGEAKIDPILDACSDKSKMSGHWPCKSHVCICMKNFHVFDKYLYRCKYKLYIIDLSTFHHWHSSLVISYAPAIGVRETIRVASKFSKVVFCSEYVTPGFLSQETWVLRHQAPPKHLWLWSQSLSKSSKHANQPVSLIALGKLSSFCPFLLRECR